MPDWAGHAEPQGASDTTHLYSTLHCEPESQRGRSGMPDVADLSLHHSNATHTLLPSTPQTALSYVFSGFSVVDSVSFQ